MSSHWTRRRMERCMAGTIHGIFRLDGSSETWQQMVEGMPVSGLSAAQPVRPAPIVTRPPVPIAHKRVAVAQAGDRCEAQCRSAQREAHGSGEGEDEARSGTGGGYEEAGGRRKAGGQRKRTGAAAEPGADFSAGGGGRDRAGGDCGTAGCVRRWRLRDGNDGAVGARGHLGRACSRAATMGRRGLPPGRRAARSGASSPPRSRMWSRAPCTPSRSLRIRG